MKKLKKKIILITGASSGIGRACAVACAETGARLILAARRLDRLEELATRLEKKHREEVCLLSLDVRDLGVVTRVIGGLPEEWSGVDVLVNSAGLARGLEPVAAGDARDWDEMIDTNVKGLLYVTRAILPGMIDRNRGHIINISSTAGKDIYPGGAVYGGTKAAVDMISRGLRMDLVGTAVRVTNIEPGMVQTEFSEVRFHGDGERAGRVYEGVTPLSPEDIADAVLYAATRSEHVNVDSIMLRPVAQASAAHLARR